ncbi:AAA family ATPase [Paenibacillus sp. 1001270B_150601_E10]|uniref:AAA family ATPase n=1 Tax=Paenibacillus sp. 1001270B_150601_E10 TaxID=2787079 RepID=UPI00189D095D|nr:AAA family ATPase [Paenibacillus sp. 1001270B_150601_E10]
MRISELQIDGLGPLQDSKFSLAAHGLTMIVGPNEAGKSSAATAIRYLLYGMPKRPASGESLSSHGRLLQARLVAIDDQEREWRIECRERSNGYQHIVHQIQRDGQVEARSLQDLEKELLGGINQEMYRRLFGITLDELHAIHTLQGEALRSFLYDAAFDAGRSLVETENWLSQEMDRLYKPRGRTQQLHLVLQEMDQRVKERRESEKLEGRLIELRIELEKQKQGLAEHSEERAAWREEMLLIERALHTRDMWIEKSALEEEREGLPNHAAWQPGWKEQMDRIHSALDNHEERKRMIERKLEQLELEQTSPDQNLLSCGAEAKQLTGQIPMIQAQSQELEERQHEHETISQELARLAQNSGSEWTVAMLLASTVAEPDQDEAREIGEKRSRLEEQAARARDERSRAGVELLMAEEAEQQALASLKRHEDLGVLGTRFSPSAYEVQRLMREIEEAARSQSVLNDYASKESSASFDTKRLYPVIFGVIGLLAAAVCVYLQEWTGAVLSLLFGLVGAGGFYAAAMPTEKQNKSSSAGQYESLTLLKPVMEALGRSSLDHPEGLDDPVEQLSRSRRGVQSHSQSRRSKTRPLVQVSGVRSPSISASMYEALDALQTWNSERERLGAEYRTVQELRKQAHRQVERASHVEEELKQELAQLHGRWIEWLKQRQLPEHWSPRSVLDHGVRAEQALTRRARMLRCSQRVEQLTASIEAFIQHCDELIEAASKLPIFTFLERWMQESGDGHSSISEMNSERTEKLQDMRAILRKMVEYYEAEEARAQANQRVEASISEWRAELEVVERERSRLHEEQRGLLSKAKVANQEQFVLRTQQAERFLYIDQRLRELKTGYYRGGDQVAMAPIEYLLTHYDEVQLEQQLSVLRHDIEHVELAIREGEQNCGRLAQEEEQLMKRMETEQWHQRTAELESELDRLGEQFAVYSIAKAIIRKTRRSYEKEKQPYVFKQAGEYIRRMTNGRYVRIVSPMGTQNIAVEREDGQLLESSCLSRGTAEQVYLAMRFALIDVLSKRAKLPMIWDELFVNFDPERLRHTLSCMPDLLARQQMIWTTCHPYMVEAVKEIIPDVHIVQL